MGFWERLGRIDQLEPNEIHELDEILVELALPRRSQSARCLIRVSLVQAFIDRTESQLTLEQLDEYWRRSTCPRAQSIRSINLDPRLAIKDVGIMCGLTVPLDGRMQRHDGHQLEIVALGARQFASRNAIRPSARELPEDKCNELEKIARLERSALDLPTTIRRTVVDARADNGLFRVLQIAYWKECSVTGIQEIRLLDACHIKPWSTCDDSERLDVSNGLLLTPNLHRLFDLGLITFGRDGKIKLSRSVGSAERELFGVYDYMALRKPMNDSMQDYMGYHNRNIFRCD